MTRFLKLVRHGNGSWQALPNTEAQELESPAPPVSTSLKKNAPIDPTQLLNALAPLLSSSGGINSIEKAPQFASLMKKFSKKLVSRCVYCNVLKSTEKETLSRFLGEGGWGTINLWLTDAHTTENIHFIIELLELCKLLPMTVERLKENNTPKVVKGLTKIQNDKVKSLSDELVTSWMKIIKGDKAPVSPVKLKKKKPAEEIKEDKVLRKPLKKPEFIAKEKKEVKKLEKKKDSEPLKNDKVNALTKRSKPVTTVKTESSVSKTSKSVVSTHKKELSPPKSSKEMGPLSKTSSQVPVKAPKEIAAVKSSKTVPSKISKELQKPPIKPRTSKRTVSDSKDSNSERTRQSCSAESLEDVKPKPEPEPVVKKLKTERPKTVKSFQTKFRATGLEVEVPLPKKVNKKTPTVDKSAAAAAVAKTTATKRLNQSYPDRITEKKLKVENLFNIDDVATPAGGIKLIPAKPQPAHVLQESTSFMDALTALPPPPIKRKKKAVAEKNTTPPSTPTSPPSTMKAPKLEFYKDTLDMSSEEPESKDDEKSSKEIEEESEAIDDTSPSSPVQEGETLEGKKEKGANSENDSSEKDSSETDAKTEVKSEDEPSEDEPSNPNELKSILAHGKRRLKRKNVRWVDDENLKMIRYFELDETERVNVFRNRTFGEAKFIEAKREREDLKAARRHAGDKMEETIPWWITPILIDCPPPLIEPGVYSEEKIVQNLRQQSILQEIYFNREMLPDSPQEPDVEPISVQEPKIIPLDEENAGPMVDYSQQEIPKPKPNLPEVLSSLIKISNPWPAQGEQHQQMIPPNPPMSQANTNPGILPNPSQMNMGHFESEESRSPGLIPPQGPPMFNPQPMMEPVPNNWGSPDSMMHGGDPQFYGNFPMNQPMDIRPPAHGMPPPRNVRPRGPPAPGNDMYRPNMPRGPPPFRPPAGPRRKTLCRHFAAGGCRFGMNCNFLHPGINGPPL